MYDKELQEILDKIKKYAPNADVTPVIKAYELAKSAHAGVFRKSGEPYIIHPIAVANILADVIIPISAIVDKLLRKGGIFISSGIIYRKEEDEVDAIKKNHKLKFMETVNQGDWRAIMAQKISD